jgi:hypothetical protein
MAAARHRHRADIAAPRHAARIQEAPMRYRVFSGPHGSAVPSALEKDRMLFKEFASLDEAMSWARHVNGSGLTALLIEGDDGTRLTKQEIVGALRNGESERADIRPG